MEKRKGKGREKCNKDFILKNVDHPDRYAAKRSQNYRRSRVTHDCVGSARNLSDFLGYSGRECPSM